MLSLRELLRAARIVGEKLNTTVVRKIVQPDEQALLLTFERPTEKSNILLSSAPEFARISVAESMAPAGAPNSFYEYARAHLPGASFAGVEVCEGNRQLGLRLRHGSEEFVLVLSILGARSNLYLLDGTARLLHSMRPLADTRRELRIGDRYLDPEGAVSDPGTDRWQDLPDALYLETIQRDYDRLEKTRGAALRVRRLDQAIRREQKFLERKFANLQEDLGEAKRAEVYRRWGEMLKGALHRIRPGDESVSVTDYQSGEVVEIPLDPKLSPAANLEACFARYQKDSRGVVQIEEQMKELGVSRAELESISMRLESIQHADPLDVGALEAMESLPVIRRLMQRRASARRPARISAPSSRKKDIPARLLPKKYSTQDGLEIWVGRNDEGNDYLTTRLARGNDLFFHLEGYPGSHVVLRTEGRLDPPQKSVLDACELAVHFSKLKNAGHADVHVAHIKDVKKPKGAKPGLVYVRSGKTIHLRRDSKRLQNILASRLDS